MALEMLKCPNCGARVSAAFAGAVAACEFCGAVLSGVGLKAPPAVAPPAVAPPAAAPPPAASPAVRPQAAPAALTEEAVLDLARRRLGAPDSLYFDGAIPRKKLDAAYETHGRSISKVLVQYDDTLFGGADDGFVMTVTTLHWKNLAEDPKSLRWGDIDPAGVSVHEEGVTVRDHQIELVLEEAKPMRAGLARLISDLAAWARGHGPPSD